MKPIEIPHSEITNVSKILCHDRKHKSKSTITFINKENKWYFKTEVDEELFSNKDGKKCDFKLEQYCGKKNCVSDIVTESNECPSNGAQYYVELKGENINDAIPQLENTIKKLYNGIEEGKAFIIFSNKSPNTSTANMKIIKSFKLKNKISLIIHKTPYEYNL